MSTLSNIIQSTHSFFLAFRDFAFQCGRHGNGWLAAQLLRMEEAASRGEENELLNGATSAWTH